MTTRTPSRSRGRSSTGCRGCGGGCRPPPRRAGAPLARSVEHRLPAMRRLLDAARERDVFTAYVNDHHGDWTANRERLTEHALGGARPELVRPIAPAEDVPFVIKARHPL